MRSYRMVDFGAPLQAVEARTPEPMGTQVLLRVRAAGVCHSDLHIWEGGYDLGFGRRMSLKDRGIQVPLTLGHETVGEVVAAGPEARGVRPGDVRLIYPWIGCRSCPVCLRGDENLCAKPRFLGVYCDGGYADHIVVPDAKYLIDLDGLDPVSAAPLACSGVTTYGALQKLADVFPTEPILVIGAGGLGLMCLSILKALDGKGAIVVDIDARKRRAALDCGALAAVDGRDPQALAEIARAAGDPVRGVIDLVGSPETAALGFDVLPKGGKLVIVGLFGGGAPWALPLIPIKAATIQGSYVGNLEELRELVGLARTGAIPAIPIVPRPLEEASAALDDLREGKLVGRAVLTPWGPHEGTVQPDRSWSMIGEGDAVDKNR
jgi:alcohol dehydrogenase/propanol-preferring alcohol dehydrogenase